MYLDILERDLNYYKKWCKDTDLLLKAIETIVFQNDKRNILLEKFMSFGLSSLATIAISGVVTSGVGFLAGIVGGFGSWFASKITFKFLFGEIRNEEDLLESEKVLVEHIKIVSSEFEKDVMKMLKKKNNIFFNNFIYKREIILKLLFLLSETDTSKLSKIYQLKFRNIVIKSNKHFSRFETVYTNVIKGSK